MYQHEHHMETCVSIPRDVTPEPLKDVLKRLNASPVKGKRMDPLDVPDITILKGLTSDKIRMMAV